MKLHHPLFLVILIGMLGCEPAPTEDEARVSGVADEAAPPEAGESAPLSHVGRAVLDRLQDVDADAWRRRTWNHTADNRLEPGWIVETPLSDFWSVPVAELPVAPACDSGPDCHPDFLLYTCDSQADCTEGSICRAIGATVTRPGDTPVKLCAGHSEENLDAIYDVVVSAQRRVDVTSLSPPTGRFEAALRNALTYLSYTGEPITARFAFGRFPGSGVGTEELMHSLTRDLASGAPLEVFVGDYRDGLDSWNHSKIIAADGARSLVGGINLWDEHYLGINPVFDLSMQLTGSAAADGQVFADELWDYLCEGTSWLGTTSITSYPGLDNHCPDHFELAVAPTGPGRTHVIAVGRLGSIGANVADEAILAMLNAAQDKVRLSLQDLGPLTKGPITIRDWPENTLTALVGALARGVDVYIILSNQNAVAGGLGSTSAGYSNGWTAEDVAQRIAEHAREQAEVFPPGTDVDALLCDRLHVTPLRPGDDEQWPDGATFANHAKTFIIDSAAFYIGSQNLYAADLAEYGYIVDDEIAAGELLEDYWNPLWHSSRAAAVSGAGAARCVL